MNDLATSLNFRMAAQKLSWARNNLDEQTYRKIDNSYSKIIKYTAIYAIFLAMIAFICFTSIVPILDKYNADAYRTGHVSGEKIWYIQNDKKELKLSDYGYDYQEFQDNEDFIVFLDKNNQVTSIVPQKEKNFEMNLPGIVMASILIGSIILLLIYMFVCYKTFGKAWHKFSVWYDKTDNLSEKFTL